MRNRFLMTSAALVLGLSLVGAACSDDESADETTTTEAAAEETTTTEAAAEESETIVDIAASNDDFTTLVTAVTGPVWPRPCPAKAPSPSWRRPTLRSRRARRHPGHPAGRPDRRPHRHPEAARHLRRGDSSAATAAVGTCVETLGGKVLISQEGEDLSFGGAKISDVDIGAPTASST